MDFSRHLVRQRATFGCEGKGSWMTFEGGTLPPRGGAAGAWELQSPVALQGGGAATLQRVALHFPTKPWCVDFVV